MEGYRKAFDLHYALHCTRSKGKALLASRACSMVPWK